MKTFTTLLLSMTLVMHSQAAPLKSAIINKVVNDVKVSEKSAPAQSASEGQKLTKSSTVLTGRKSRVELLFQDQTVTRVGANSIFRFGTDSRDMEINKGSFLLQVPKNAGGAKIRTATVTAAITGTTVMMEYSPGKWLKFIVLEGVASLTNKNGDTIEVKPGQMLVMNPDAQDFPKLLTINIDKLVKTSKLLDKDIFGELDGEAVILIDNTVVQQLELRRKGALLPSGVLVNGPGASPGNPGIEPSIQTILPVRKDSDISSSPKVSPPKVSPL